MNPALSKSSAYMRKSGAKVGITKILSTFFGIGYLPYFPGTWASLTGFGIYFLLHNSVVYLYVIFTVVILGFLISGKAEEEFGIKDCRFIVIDEIAAVLILLYLIPRDLFFLILAFFVFRIFDIVKPCPIKKIESFSGSWGIMLDDIAACFYTVGFVWLIILLRFTMQKH